MNDNQIKKPESQPLSTIEKQEIKIVVEKIAELIRIAHT